MRRCSEWQAAVPPLWVSVGAQPLARGPAVPALLGLTRMRGHWRTWPQACLRQHTAFLSRATPAAGASASAAAAGSCGRRCDACARAGPRRGTRRHFSKRSLRACRTRRPPVAAREFPGDAART